MYHQWLLASTEVRLYPLIIGAIKKNYKSTYTALEINKLNETEFSFMVKHGLFLFR